MDDTIKQKAISETFIQEIQCNLCSRFWLEFDVAVWRIDSIEVCVLGLDAELSILFLTGIYPLSSMNSSLMSVSRCHTHSNKKLEQTSTYLCCWRLVTNQPIFSLNWTIFKQFSPHFFLFKKRRISQICKQYLGGIFEGEIGDHANVGKT